MPDVNAADFQRMRSERDAMSAELMMWKGKFHRLEQQYAALQVAHAEVISTTGYKKKKAHEYGPDECRPLSLGEVCPVEKCQYDYRPDSPRFMMRPHDKVKEPHPTAHV